MGLSQRRRRRQLEQLWTRPSYLGQPAPHRAIERELECACIGSWLDIACPRSSHGEPGRLQLMDGGTQSRDPKCYGDLDSRRQDLRRNRSWRLRHGGGRHRTAFGWLRVGIARHVACSAIVRRIERLESGRFVRWRCKEVKRGQRSGFVSCVAPGCRARGRAVQPEWPDPGPDGIRAVERIAAWRVGAAVASRCDRAPHPQLPESLEVASASRTSP